MKEILIRLLSNLRKSAQSADHLFLLFFCVVCSAVADEPFFKKGDVIALVGGEDMVAMSEYGYLELLLQRALPDYHLKFRDLAWEGDTVFEQHRDLNFPPLEAQLDQVGATVVLCQFGQMESLAGKEKLPEFIAAYEKLIGRFSGGGKRRFLLISPQLFGYGSNTWVPAISNLESRNEILDEYAIATHKMAERCGVHFEMISGTGPDSTFGSDPRVYTRDGVHVDWIGNGETANQIAMSFDPDNQIPWRHDWENESEMEQVRPPELEHLRQLIRAKNRLWFNYWRVENWAFLAGDRTEQPSSRDHVDRTRRWFPAERERFLPLIEAKEQEIWALATKLAEQK